MIRKIIEGLDRNGNKIDLSNSSFIADVGKILKKLHFRYETTNVDGVAIYIRKTDAGDRFDILDVYSAPDRRFINLHSIDDEKVMADITKKLKPIMKKYHGFIGTKFSDREIITFKL